MQKVQKETLFDRETAFRNATLIPLITVKSSITVQDDKIFKKNKRTG